MRGKQGGEEASFATPCLATVAVLQFLDRVLCLQQGLGLGGISKAVLCADVHLQGLKGLGCVFEGVFVSDIIDKYCVLIATIADNGVPPMIREHDKVVNLL